MALPRQCIETPKQDCHDIFLQFPGRICLPCWRLLCRSGFTETEFCSQETNRGLPGVPRQCGFLQGKNGKYIYTRRGPKPAPKSGCSATSRISQCKVMASSQSNIGTCIIAGPLCRRPCWPSPPSFQLPGNLGLKEMSQISPRFATSFASHSSTSSISQKRGGQRITC
jgi:hypothetical protein